MTITPPAPTVTAATDADPCPRAQIVITPMPLDAVSLTVWRYSDGRRSIVRGASNVPVAGDTGVVDYEVPLGESVTYTAQTVDSGGTPSQVSSPSTAILVDSPYSWASDPLDPASSIALGMTSNSGMPAEAMFASFRTATFSLAATLAPVFGSGDPLGFADIRQNGSGIPLVIRSYDLDTFQLAATLAPVFGSGDPLGFADIRQNGSGIPLVIRSYDLDTFTRLRALLQQAYPLCVRAGASVPLVPGVLYLSIPAVTPTLDPDNVTATWSMTGDSIAPPGASVLIPARTLDDLGDEASSLDGLADLYDSLVALQLGA